LNAELNPICHLLALVGAHHILHVSRIKVKLLKAVLEIKGKQGSQSDVTYEKCGWLDTVTLPSCLKCICMFDHNNNVNVDTVTYIPNYFSSQTHRVTSVCSY
jgi:hypothetical protein